MAETSLYKLVNGNGQINYSDFRQFVAGKILSEFTEESPHPFLIGKDLYEGEIKPKLGATVTSTLKFKFAEFDLLKEKKIKEVINSLDDEELDSEKLKRIRTQIEKNWEKKKENIEKEKENVLRYIYVLRKKPVTSIDNYNIITIGRNGTNDIVIQDNVVSGRHAQISILNGMYFITDMGSTNGTKIDSKKLQAGIRVQIPFNATIDFGRLSFVFAHPLQVYRFIRKEIMGV